MRLLIGLLYRSVAALVLLLPQISLSTAQFIITQREVEEEKEMERMKYREKDEEQKKGRVNHIEKICKGMAFL